MRKVKSLQQIGLGTGLALLSAFGHPITVSVGLGAIATLTLSTPADAATLTRWQFDPSARQLEITVPEGVTPRYFLLAQPARIVLDLPNTSVGSVSESQTYSGAIRQIRVGEFQPGLTRIVIELSPDAVLATGQVELRRVDGVPSSGTSGSRWILRPLLEGDAPPVANRPQPSSPAVQVPPPSSSTPAGALPLPSPELPPTAPPAIAPPATGSTANLPSLVPTPPLTSADLQTPEPPAGVSPTAPGSTALATPPPVSPPTAPSTAPAQESSSLPPLEPNALEIPIDPPRAASPQPSPSASPPQALSPQALDSAPSETLSTASPEPTAETTSELAVAPAADQAAVPAEMNGRSPNAPPPSSSAPTPNSTERNERSPNVTPSSSSSPLNPTERGEQSAAIPSVPSQSALPLVPPSPTTATAPMPIALPPSSPSSNSPVTVQVPPLASGTPMPVQPAPPTASSVSMPAPAIATQPTTSTLLPPAVLSTNPTNRVTVPPLNSPSTTAPVPTSPSRIEPPPTQQAAVSNPAILLPSGTVLSLRYPRDTVLQLQAGGSWQEVLVVAEDVRDRSGAVLVPEGSQVIGRFETSDQGSRFIAQAITVQGRNVQLRGQSDVLAGDRQVSDDNLMRNSAIGGAALTVLGLFTGGIGFLAGALAGAAAGAATTYITAPQPAIIQPNQVVEVRLSEDVPRVF